MNNYGHKAKDYLAQYCPTWYSEIEDKEAFFTEIGEEAQRQVSSTYSNISRPELGERDLASKMMAEELVHELIYPSPSEESEEPMDPNSAMAFSMQVQQDLWAEPDSDQMDSRTSPPPER